MAVGGYVDVLDNQTLAAMTQANMTLIRWNIPFSDEPEVNANTIVFVRSIIAQSHAAGFSVVLTVVPQSVENPDTPERNAAFQEFAVQVATQAPDAIELWAKPELLSTTTEAIKATNPRVLVISGALAPAELVNNASYYESLETIDCVGVMYEADEDSSASDLVNDLGTIRETVLTKPLCLTALSYAADSAAVEEQANFYEELFNNPLDGVMLIAIYRVAPVEGALDFVNSHALIREDGSCPACDAIGAR
jgi:hypothetical protein